MKNTPARVIGLTMSGLICSYGLHARQKANPGKVSNIVLIVADDLNSSTTSMFGSKVDDITPNLAKLASQGMLFRHAHVAASVSQVSRGALMTGRYPHRNGIDGFYQTTLDIPTFQEILQDHRYRIGILGKNTHSTPKASIKWDLALDELKAGNGRNPELYYQLIRKFIAESKDSNRPFFFMANSHDPHRPFAGSDQEKKVFPNPIFPQPSRIYKEKEVEIPGFLPNLPFVHKEIAEYYSSVKRLDETVGAVLKAIKDSGTEKETIVVFLSDNGMALPFAKTNCYLHSTHTPLIIKLPGVTKPKSENHNLVNIGIDFMPTILEALQLPVPEGLDGESLLPGLRGDNSTTNEYIYTQFTEISGKRRFPMRAILCQRFAYIFNPWSDGTRLFSNESQSGRTFAAMVQASDTSQVIKQRVELFRKRILEEFYDFSNDPDALTNLIDHPDYQEEINTMRRALENHFLLTEDPVLQVFRNRYDPKALQQFMEEQALIIQKRLK